MSSDTATPPHKKLIVSDHASPWACSLGLRPVTDSVGQKCLAMLRASHSQTRAQWGLGEAESPPKTLVAPSPPPLPRTACFRPPPKRRGGRDGGTGPDVWSEHVKVSPSSARPSRPLSDCHSSTTQKARPATAARTTIASHCLNSNRRPHTALTPATHRHTKQLSQPAQTQPMSPRIVTLDGGAPRLKLFGPKGGHVKLLKHSTTSSALLRIGGFGSDGQAGSIEKSARVLRHWKRDPVNFVRELWVKIERAQRSEPQAWVRGSSQAAVRERKRQQNTIGLNIEGFKEFMHQVGCSGFADLPNRIFQLMLHPAHMDAASIIQQPISRITFEQFVRGCKATLSSRNPGRRIRNIFNFYDTDRIGHIDRGQLFRGLVHVPSIQLQQDPEVRRNKVLSLITKIWIALEQCTDDSTEHLSILNLFIDIVHDFLWYEKSTREDRQSFTSFGLGLAVNFRLMLIMVNAAFTFCAVNLWTASGLPSVERAIDADLMIDDDVLRGNSLDSNKCNHTFTSMLDALKDMVAANISKAPAAFNIDAAMHGENCRMPNAWRKTVFQGA